MGKSDKGTRDTAAGGIYQVGRNTRQNEVREYQAIRGKEECCRERKIGG